MNILPRALVLIAAALALPRPACAQDAEPLASEQAVRATFESGRWSDATRQTNRLIQARAIALAAPRPDSELDRLIGELLASSAPATARLLLERAVADPTTSDRAHYALLLAQAEEVIGDDGAAEQTYRRLLADGSRLQDRRPAIVGLARLLLISRPRESLKLLGDLLSTPAGPAERWEAELLASRAERMLGMQSEAAAHLELASQHAWSAPVGDAAIARIAQDRAMIAGLAGDRQTLIALTAVSRSGARNDAIGQFMNLLPECGSHNIAPADFVVVELIPRPIGSPRVDLVYASRPEIAAPFLALILRTPLQAPSGQVMSILLRCSTAPQTGAIKTWDNPIVEWGARIGAYPLLQTDPSGDKTDYLAVLAERESRLGAESAALIPVLAALLSSPPERFEPPSTDMIARQLGYARRLETLLRAHNASADARLWVSLAVTTLSAIAVEQPQQTAERMVRTLLQSSAADPALTLETLLAMAAFVPTDSSAAPGLKITLLAQALERMRGAGSREDPRLRGLAVRLARLRFEAGDPAAAAATLRTYNIPADLCATMEIEPHTLSSEFRSEDYPSDAVWGSLRGMVGFDFRLDAQGVIHDPRVIVSGPPLIFDAATLARAPSVRQEPARAGGSARACRGNFQRIRWQLPD